MVYTSNAIITAILAVSAAAPILAAPAGSRVGSGISSVNNRAPVPPPPTQPGAVPAPASAPEAAARVTSSDVGPAVLNHHLAAREAEVEASVKTGTAESEGFLHSPIAQNLLGRTALTAISSILRREPEFADLLLRELAREPGARNAHSSAITGGAASDAGIQHLNRAGMTTPNSIYENRAPPAESSSDSSPSAQNSPLFGSLQSAHSATSYPSQPAVEGSGSFQTADGGPASESPPAYSAPEGSGSFHTADGDAAPEGLPAYPVSEGSGSFHTADGESLRLLAYPASEGSGSFHTVDGDPAPESPSENPPSTGTLSQLKSLVNNPVKAVLTGLTVGAAVSAIALGTAKDLGHLRRRDLDADTLHLLGRALDADTLSLLLGRDLEDLFARSSGIDELD